MRIAVIGLGYVGAVTGSCLVGLGHDVIVIEKNSEKIDLFNSGISPISEPGLTDLIAQGLASGKLKATNATNEELLTCDMVIVSVGTPTDPASGRADLTSIQNVANDISTALKTRTTKLRIAIASTVPPGTTEGIVRKFLVQKGISEEKFALAFIPEFLREGSAISDFLNPTRFIIGSRSETEAQEFVELRPELKEITHLTKTETSEMLKTVENSWHATKITFANEIGRISKSVGVDENQVMELLIADKKQNISATYMRPGFAFGGSCLPKDLRSLVFLGQSNGVQIPLLAGISQSNSLQIEVAVNQIVDLKKQRIGVLGLAFKANTDDLRESPAVVLIERLMGKGFKVNIHDFEVDGSKLFGVNLSTWNQHAHLADNMVTDIGDLLAESDVLVLAQHNPRYLDVIANLGGDKILLDLTGLTRK
ncbi:MAG: nucleotide sugar dehydrogenase [Actinomycetes bacterium]